MGMGKLGLESQILEEAEMLMEHLEVEGLVDPGHYGPEATPTNKKSTGRSESSSDTTMTSPVTKKNFKIGPLGDFEKSAFLYFHPSQYNLAPGIKGATDQMLP